MRIKGGFYPSSETDRMLRILAGVKGTTYNAVVLEAIEMYLSHAVLSGEFDNSSEVVAAFKARLEESTAA